MRMKRFKKPLVVISILLFVYVLCVFVLSFFTIFLFQSVSKNISNRKYLQASTHIQDIQSIFTIYSVGIPFLKHDINAVQPMLSESSSFLKDADIILLYIGNVFSGVATENQFEKLKQHMESGLNAVSLLRKSAIIRGVLKNTKYSFIVGDPSYIQDTMQAVDFCSFFLSKEYSHGEKTYLVLLQNNMELRPTGGFLGSYARIRMKDGVLIDIKTEDIYVPDGELLGYVEPPKPVKDYLFQTGGWKLRDANWNPDFPLSAQSVVWFYEQATKEKIDGVIAINLSTVENVFKVIGPVSLPDYNQVVTSESLYSFVQVETEHEFFPGSTNKTAVLGSLWRNVKLHVVSLSFEKKLALLHVFIDSLEHGETLVWFSNVDVQTKVVEKGWDGGVRKEHSVCFEDGCIADYLYIVESNVGINKTNCCVERKVHYIVTFDEYGLQHTKVKIWYKNNNDVIPNPPKSYGGGYNNYLRLYKPSTYTLKSFQSDGVLVPTTSFDHENDDSLDIDGILVQVSGKSEKTVEYTYVPTKEINLGKPVIYTLYVQKQPGLTTNAYEITIKLPNSYVFEDGTHEKHVIQSIEKNTQFSFRILPKESL